MRGFLIRWAASALTLLFLANNVDGFEVKGIKPAFLAVAVLTLGNLLLQPVAYLVTRAGCLLNLLTLGLFEGLVGLLFWIIAFFLIGAGGGTQPLIAGFKVDGLEPAAIGAISLTLVNFLINPWVNRDHRDQRRDRREQRDRRREA